MKVLTLKTRVEQLLKELRTAKGSRQNECATGLAQSAISETFVEFDAFSLYHPPPQSSNSSSSDQTFQFSGDLLANWDNEFSSSSITGGYVAQDGSEPNNMFDW